MWCTVHLPPMCHLLLKRLLERECHCCRERQQTPQVLHILTSTAGLAMKLHSELNFCYDPTSSDSVDDATNQPGASVTANCIAFAFCLVQLSLLLSQTLVVSFVGHAHYVGHGLILQEQQRLAFWPKLELGHWLRCMELRRGLHHLPRACLHKNYNDLSYFLQLQH